MPFLKKYSIFFILLDGLVSAQYAVADSMAGVSDDVLSGAPASGCGEKAQEGFLGRLYDSYADHLKVTGEENTPPAAYRGTPAPLPSPPFPGSTWNIGGTTPIGYDSMTTGPLMDAIYCGKNGQAIKDSRITVYGWVDPGYNWSTSHHKFSTSTGSGGNGPEAYDVYPNSLAMDQAVLYIERTPDTVQTDHIDWGFRIANLYGTDYKYTFSKGVFSNQYLGDHNKYGYDPVLVYGDLYIPYVAEGMNVRLGRFLSIPDIEAQLAPNNYTYSHSLLYSVDPYTQEGIMNTVRLDKNWTFQLGLSDGDDTAIGTSSATPTLHTCVSWTSDSGNDNLYPCINGVNTEGYGYNNLQMLVGTWYHKFDSKWHMATEAYYLWERDVPNLNNPNAAALIPGPNSGGAFCDNATSAACTAHAYAVVNYIEYQIAPLDFLTFRNEFLNDEQGQRTGFQTKYSEHLLGWTHWIGDVITIRPEIRFERSYGTAAYDDGNQHNQTTIATDVIFHY